MTDQPIRTLEYRDWLTDIKQRIRQAQVKAAVQVNSALLTFYWELGAEIVERQKSSQWGSGFLKQLSTDLMAEFPDMKGFSFNNLQHIKRWYLFYTGGLSNPAAGCGHIEQQVDSKSAEKSDLQNVAQAVPQLDDGSIQLLDVKRDCRLGSGIFISISYFITQNCTAMW
ncbi:MAG: DUF1016 N-terminal domain-containing protein [Desulfobacteraceae bacterium]|nr:DUF1016 N-terminal domain-containing protein [Desulfobacteraceae bacterium]